MRGVSEASREPRTPYDTATPYGSAFKSATTSACG